MRRALLALALAGCIDVERPVLSSDVASGDLSLPLVVRTAGPAIEISVTVLGPAGTITLVEGDRLRVRLGGQEIEPVVVARGAYLARADAALYGDVVVVLERPRDAAVETRAFVPPPFRVTTPPRASRAAALTIAWDAATGPYATTLTVGGPCVAPVVRTLASDVGSYTFNPYELASSAAAPGECTATVTVTKSSPSVAAPTASRVATATFVSEP